MVKFTVKINPCVISECLTKHLKVRFYLYVTCKVQLESHLSWKVPCHCDSASHVYLLTVCHTIMAFTVMQITRTSSSQTNSCLQQQKTQTWPLKCHLTAIQYLILQSILSQYILNMDSKQLQDNWDKIAESQILD